LYYFLLRINLTFIISFFIIFIGFFTKCLLCYNRIIYNILLSTLVIVIVTYCFMGSITSCSCTDCYDDVLVFVQNFKRYLHRIIYISAFIFLNILYLYFLIYFITNISYSYYLYYMPNIPKIAKIIILLHPKTY
jgi:hypothetical protein